MKRIFKYAIIGLFLGILAWLVLIALSLVGLVSIIDDWDLPILCAMLALGVAVGIIYGGERNNIEKKKAQAEAEARRIAQTEYRKNLAKGLKKQSSSVAAACKKNKSAQRALVSTTYKAPYYINSMCDEYVEDAENIGKSRSVLKAANTGIDSQNR